MFPEAFETALAKLEVGQVSQPVTTDAGTHIIKLLEIQQSTFEWKHKDSVLRMTCEELLRTFSRKA